MQKMHYCFISFRYSEGDCPTIFLNTVLKYDKELNPHSLEIVMKLLLVEMKMKVHFYLMVIQILEMVD